MTMPYKYNIDLRVFRSMREKNGSRYIEKQAIFMEQEPKQLGKFQAKGSDNFVKHI